MLDVRKGAVSTRAADILVKDGVIDSVEPGLAGRINLDGIDVVDATSLLALPGLVNAHYHSHDVLLKGMFDVMSLERWAVRALPRFYPPRSDRELRIRTLLGAAECLRGGITTVQDMLSLWPLTESQAIVVRDAYREAGIRVVLGVQLADRGILDTVPMLRDILPADLHAAAGGPVPPTGMPDPLAELEAILSSAPDAPSSLVSWAVCPSSPERCSRNLLERLHEAAMRHGLRLFAHIAISRVEAVAAQRLFAAHGGSPVRYLSDVGMLGPRLTLAHGVWLDESDRALLADTDTRVVMNPMSNLKTRNGVAPFRSYLRSGLTLGLGCDNCSCSDAQNMFQAMKLSVLLAGIDGRTDETPGAADALWAATEGGAQAIGLEDSVGRIVPGRRADITFLDLADPVFRPLNDIARQTVYGEGGRGVVSVMIDGTFVMRDRQLTTIDEAGLVEELEEVMPGLRLDAAQVLQRAELLDPYLGRMEEMSWGYDAGLSRMICQ